MPHTKAHMHHTCTHLHTCTIQMYCSACSELVGVQYEHGELSFCTHLKGRDFLEGLGL